MDGEFERMCNKGLFILFEKLSYHLLVRTEENRNTLE